MSCSLQVAIQFEPRWLKIGFRHNWQAQSYADRIRCTWIHDACRLESRVIGPWVLIRLPSFITEIISSASCPGYSGFYFRFSDTFIAKKWEESLLCFRRIKGSKTDLYIVRNINEKEIFGFGRG